MREGDQNNMRSAELATIPESREISKETLGAYIEGCESLAVKLDTAIEKVIAAGKRPVVLIPSRGAIPIFLLARKFLTELRGEESFLNEKRANYYPPRVFNYLEGEEAQTPDAATDVDVILYPFTADVSLETNGDETLARELRNSCTRSVMQIVKGIDYKQHDLEWYRFLMGKLSENPHDPNYLKAKNILASLDSFNPTEDSQIIVIDTVISGRAATDITTAFKTLGHTVLPLLAVDSTKGGKFDKRRRWGIEETLRPIWDLTPEGEPFEEFPLISEDKGAALLGVTALNFINFNEVGAFNRVTQRFPFDLRPQSCVWVLPPVPVRDMYLHNFRNFLDLAWRSRNGSQNPPSDEEIRELQETSRSMTTTHVAPTFAEVSSQVQIEKGAEFKETASHIVSVKLTEKQASGWIKEFASTLTHSAP